MSNEAETEEGETASIEAASGKESDEDGGEATDDLERRKRRLDERELGLDRRSEDLDERETTLDEREANLDERAERLANKRQELEEWETQLEGRADELDEREANIEDVEEELSERARELSEHEETLNNYLEDQVDDLETTITETMWSALDTHGTEDGRFGATGTLLVGFAGLVLAIAGAGYAVALGVKTSGLLFGTTGPDVALCGALLVVGLALNLLTVTDRL
jgi:ribonuclease Y